MGTQRMCKHIHTHIHTHTYTTCARQVQGTWVASERVLPGLLPVPRTVLAASPLASDIMSANAPCFLSPPLTPEPAAPLPCLPAACTDDPAGSGTVCALWAAPGLPWAPLVTLDLACCAAAVCVALAWRAPVTLLCTCKDKPHRSTAKLRSEWISERTRAHGSHIRLFCSQYQTAFQIPVQRPCQTAAVVRVLGVLFVLAPWDVHPRTPGFCLSNLACGQPAIKKHAHTHTHTHTHTHGHTDTNTHTDGHS